MDFFSVVVQALLWSLDELTCPISHRKSAQLDGLDKPVLVFMHHFEFEMSDIDIWDRPEGN